MSLILSGTDGVQGNSGAIVSGTAVTASGSSVNFTGIPSWVTRITLLLNGLSYAAASGVSVIRVGTGGVLTTTGYNGSFTNLTDAPGITITSSTNGFGGINQATSAANTLIGTAILNRISGNTWVQFGSYDRSGESRIVLSNGSITLSGPLDIISLVATTSTFDAGTINIIYE